MTTHYEGQLSLADIADLAGVTRPAVSNWRARNDDFPAPVEGSPERRPLFSFHEVLTWLAGQKLLPSNWKTNATAVLVSSAINPMAVGSGGSATVVLVALAVLAVYKNGGGEEWDELLEQEEDAYSALTRFLKILSPDVLSGEQVANIIAETSSTPEDDLKTMVNGLGQVDEGSYDAAADIIIGSIFGRSGRGALGHYTTSTEVSELMINAARTTTSAGATVFDPTCGASGMLLGLGAHIDNGTLIGNDVEEDAVVVSALRVYLNDLSAEFSASDILTDDPQPGLQADTIVCEPPFGPRMSSENFKTVSSFLKPYIGAKFRPMMGAEPAFLVYAATHLAPKGRAYVLTNTTLCSDEKLEDFRSKLVARGMVEAIVQLPQRLLNTTSIPTALWVLRAPNSSKASSPVLLADASEAEDPEKNIAEWLTSMREGKEATIPSGTITLADMVTGDSILLPSRVLKEPLDTDAIIHEFNESWESLYGIVQNISSTLPENRPVVDELPKSSVTTPLSKIESLSKLNPRYFRSAEEAGEDSVSARVLRSRNEREPEEVFINKEASALRPGDLIIPWLPHEPASVFEDEEGVWVPKHQTYALRVNGSDFLPEYLAACVNAQFNEVDDGSRIPRRRPSDIKIPLLDVEEQRKIVEATDSLRKISAQADTLAKQADSALTAAINLVYFGADM